MADGMTHPRQMGHGGDFWQNAVQWRRQWQTTLVFLPWEPHEQYKKGNYCQESNRNVSWSNDVFKSNLSSCFTDYKIGNWILRKQKGKQANQAEAISVASTQGQLKGGSGNADQKKTILKEMSGANLLKKSWHKEKTKRITWLKCAHFKAHLLHVNQRRQHLPEENGHHFDSLFFCLMLHKEFEVILSEPWECISNIWEPTYLAEYSNLSSMC